MGPYLSCPKHPRNKPTFFPSASEAPSVWPLQPPPPPRLSPHLAHPTLAMRPGLPEHKLVQPQGKCCLSAQSSISSISSFLHLSNLYQAPI